MIQIINWIKIDWIVSERVKELNLLGCLGGGGGGVCRWRIVGGCVSLPRCGSVRCCSSRVVSRDWWIVPATQNGLKKHYRFIDINKESSSLWCFGGVVGRLGVVWRSGRGVISDWDRVVVGLSDGVVARRGVSGCRVDRGCRCVISRSRIIPAE